LGGSRDWDRRRPSNWAVIENPKDFGEGDSGGDSGEDPHYLIKMADSYHKALDDYYLVVENLDRMLMVDGGGPQLSHE
jgi:hypothetical protein